MTYFYADIYDEITGALLFEDLECEVDTSVSIVGGHPEIEIGDVKIDGKSLSKGEPLSKALLGVILNMIEADLKSHGTFYDDVLEDHGIVYRGRGGNDPDGEWVLT